jgi:luciferase family oxidoreductase group 1
MNPNKLAQKHFCFRFSNRSRWWQRIRHLQNSLNLQKVENWGYKRFWLAEHHNMQGIASSATVILIGHIANGTNSLRVGSGGIMLPNHAPLVVAEQFGTLATLSQSN